jgi:hypothetical protein
MDWIFSYLNVKIEKLCIGICVLFLFSNLHAQLSPGDLQKSHAFLEGIENCTKCHEQGQKLSADNCLNCHTLLKEQISNNRGLHAGSAYRDCAKCHVEHLGRDYELVYWGKPGKSAFNHSETGYELKGAHLKLECSKCHNESNIVNKDRLRQKKKNLTRTFLGLNQQCSSCHQDEHRGQLNANCVSCHNMNDWKSASTFNHNNTGFRLTGKHISVKCQQCHKIIKDDKYADNPTYLNFSIKKSNSCMDCHKDVHNHRFGKNCTKCHNTTGWSNYNKNGFDHSKTKYPLRGKHAFLRCEQCHRAGKPMKIIQSQKWMDCHRDEHQGQFSQRAQKGACEECHSVAGFSPSKFTLDMHQECAYPLKGSHLAVPCLECHKTQAKATHKNKFIPFRFNNTQCITCHEDIHHGQVEKIVQNSGCEGCHSIESWRTVYFDHNKTGFSLESKHKQATCRQCHFQETALKSAQWHFEGLSKECSSCHKDIHQGQFSRQNQPTDCGRCHSPLDWLADRFNHEKDSFFSLQGAHKFVACDKCHKVGQVNGKQVTIYKPLDKRCESCHKG